jgi:hypothetical protein
VFAIDTAANLLALMLWSVISKMLGTFYNSFSWPEGRKAGSMKCTHVVMCIDKDLADSWLMTEVIIPWHQLYQGTLLSQKYRRGDTFSKGEVISLKETITIYHECLYDISWLMRNINEYIAREAKKEDKCTGRFYSPPSLSLTLRTN